MCKSQNVLTMVWQNSLKYAKAVRKCTEETVNNIADSAFTPLGLLFSALIFWLWQREERKMLLELKLFLDQLERDLLRAQGAEGSLTDKYQVSCPPDHTSIKNRPAAGWLFQLVLQVFKSFHVQYEMKKKQTVPMLQPIHKDGKLSVDQALVKQAWDRLSARVNTPLN